jgi:hypothetical protein
MSKKRKHAQESKLEEYFDYDDVDPWDVDAINNVVVALNEARLHHMNTALELTRLISEKGAIPMTEEHILTSFKRAFHMVSEVCPLQELLNKLEPPEIS